MNNSPKNIYKQTGINYSGYCVKRYLSLPLQVERIGFIHNKTEHVDRLFALPSICFCISGTGTLEENGKIRTVRAPFMLCNLTGDRKCYIPEKNWDELYIGFSGKDEAVLKSILPENFFNKRLQKLAHPDTTLSIISRLLEIINGPMPEGSFDQIDLLTLELLLSTIISPQSEQRSQQEETLIKITRFIETHCNEELDLKKTAAKFGFSYSTFQRYWKQNNQIPPRDFYNNLRNTKAIEMLSSPRFSIGEVSAELGFKNQFYFSRFFRKMNGVSPRQWRNLQQQENN